MRVIHIVGVLLAITICSIAGNSAAAIEDAKVTNQQQGVVANITTVPAGSTSSPAVVDKINTTATNPTTNTTSGSATTPTVIPFISTISTVITDKTTNNTTNVTTPTTKIPVPPITETPTNTTTEKPKTTTTTSTEHPTTNGTVTTSPVPVTTAIPVSTKEAPSTPSPYKERHFDGLSFMGGIILATCLMAIGVLSWKFYRTFNERNYRTL
ncbi:integumentary mucin C.1-like [Ceratina calcarata]|uniref:Integumentary mucin C.1-like n=1 Tax=Ceratina calcarata TaxID=156304 RepID=A0AAJ7IYR1_9HYME|nr:integumentary mucin C.1-like [Ceratina calcarata]